MDNKQLSVTSKFLSYVLRHEPQAIGLQLDSEGWANIESLIAGAAKSGINLNKSIIQAIISSSDKKRFSLSSDGKSIRAAQGHSAAGVNLQHTEKEPPEFLYHGTATRFLESIYQQGLQPGSRHHVHLSSDAKTAIAVGMRHGRAAVLKIAALKMYSQGFKFFQSENGVWLVESVPTDFIHESAD